MPLSPKLNQQEAEKCARDVLEELALQALPILPIEIARRKEILVQSFVPERPGLAGFLMVRNNRFGIGYADHLANEGFVNFTVAHELGHYFLPGHVEFLFSDGNSIHYSASPFTSPEPHEKQADMFSAGLLMPEHLFLPALRKCRPVLHAIKELASLCRTSRSATAIRYGQSAEDPVAIVVSTGQEVDYCVICPTLLEIPGISPMRRGDSIPTSTATARFNRDYENVLGAEEVESTCCLTQWFPDAPKHEMNEDVLGLGKYNKTLTVLFTEHEIDFEEDAEPEIDSRFRRS